MTLPIDLIFIRHGESEGNLAKRQAEAGKHDRWNEITRDRHTRSLRLTDKGRRQAEKAGIWLRDNFPNGFDRYIVSEYTRAMETAGLLQLPDATWYTNFFLTERDWGELDNCTAEEREDRFGDALRRRDVEPFFWRPLNGESLAQGCIRLYQILTTLHRECSDKQVIIVCHGEVMWMFRVLLERMSQERFKVLHESKDPVNRIFNTQVLHYTRRDPSTGRIGKHANWMRMVRPSDQPVWDSGWQTITRPTYSNEELLKVVDTYPALLLA